MNLDSARNAKQDALGVVSQIGRNDALRRKLGVRAQSIEMGSHAPSTEAGLLARAEFGLLFGSPYSGTDGR